MLESFRLVPGRRRCRSVGGPDRRGGTAGTRQAPGAASASMPALRRGHVSRRERLADELAYRMEFLFRVGGADASGRLLPRPPLVREMLPDPGGHRSVSRPPTVDRHL